jgi:hypothetical protein
MRNMALGALGMAAALTLAFAGSAAAGLVGDEVTIKFKPISDPAKMIYKGKVRSENPDCVEDRIVSFKAKGKRLAKAATDDRGKFNVKGKRPKSGTVIKIKVKPTGECMRLTGSEPAP